jgi:hypothetical protein
VRIARLDLAASSRVGDRISTRHAARRGAARLGQQPVQHRQREGGGLAGAGLGDAEQVAALEDEGMACAWIGVGRRRIAFGRERLEKELGEAEIGKVGQEQDLSGRRDARGTCGYRLCRRIRAGLEFI